jgi:hypothetical protein
MGTTKDSNTFYTTDTLYVDWAVVNDGPVDTGVGFSVALYVDEGLKNTFSTSSPLNADYYWPWNDYPIGSLSAGLHRIKIVVDSTGLVDESNEGDNEYSKTIIVLCPTPGTPSNPSPTNGATGISTSPTLSWGALNADSYDVYFGTSSNPPYVGNTTSTSYPRSGLSYSTIYYWKIVARNNCGNSTSGSVWSFTTITEDRFYSQYSQWCQ